MTLQRPLTATIASMTFQVIVIATMIRMRRRSTSRRGNASTIAVT